MNQRQLEDVLRQLDTPRRSSRRRGLTLQRLKDDLRRAEPLAKWVAPAQTVCNYWNYWFTYLPNALSDRDQSGYSFRQIARRDIPGSTDDSRRRAAGYSGLQSNGLDPTGVFKPYQIPILHAHPYQPTGQHNADCQGGQSGYRSARACCRASRRATRPTRYRDLPGSRGPTTLVHERRRPA